MVELIANAILNCPALGDVVLDPFSGSGTALVAAERMCSRSDTGGPKEETLETCETGIRKPLANLGEASQDRRG